jgi:hypothetical protein
MTIPPQLVQPRFGIRIIVGFQRLPQRVSSADLVLRVFQHACGSTLPLEGAAVAVFDAGKEYALRNRHFSLRLIGHANASVFSAVDKKLLEEAAEFL